VLCCMRVLAVSWVILLLAGYDVGSKLDLYIQAQVMVLSVMSLEHGNGKVPKASCIFWLIELMMYSFWLISKDICSSVVNSYLHPMLEWWS